MLVIIIQLAPARQLRGGDNNRNNRHGLESNTVPAVHYFCSAEGQYYVKDVVILYIGAGLVLFKRAWGDTDKVPSTRAHAAVAYDTIMNQQVISFCYNYSVGAATLLL